MVKLIKAEFYKLIKSRGYRILILSILAFFICLGIISKRDGCFSFILSTSDIFTHSIFVSLFAASFICNEFTDRTFSMSMCCGFSRRKVFISKLIVYFIGLLLLLLLNQLAITLTTTIKNGFGRELTYILLTELMKRLFYCLIWYMVIGSFFVLISSIIRNKIGVVFVGTLGCYIALYILMVYEEGKKAQEALVYVLLYQVRLFSLDWESVSGKIFIWESVIIFVLSIVLSVFIFEKRDLK